jgi:hypothetical protein
MVCPHPLTPNSQFPHSRRAIRRRNRHIFATHKPTSMFCAGELRRADRSPGPHAQYPPATPATSAFAAMKLGVGCWELGGGPGHGPDLQEDHNCMPVHNLTRHSPLATVAAWSPDRAAKDMGPETLAPCIYRGPCCAEFLSNGATPYGRRRKGFWRCCAVSPSKPSRNTIGPPRAPGSQPPRTVPRSSRCPALSTPPTPTSMPPCWPSAFARNGGWPLAPYGSAWLNRAFYSNSPL